MKQKTRTYIRILRKAAGRCSRFLRTIRIVYSRRRVHRQLRGSLRMLVLLHHDIYSSSVVAHLFSEIELWLSIGFQVRLRRVKEKTTDGNAGLLLFCHGGKSVCRTMIRMQQVESGVVVFGIQEFADSLKKSPTFSICNNHSNP